DRDDVNSALANLLLSCYLGDRNRPKHLYDLLADLSKRLLAKNPKSYEGLRVKAYLAATDGKIQEALELFRQADSVKPWQPDLIQIWADLLFRARQSEEGEKLALGLIQKDPHYGPIYDLLYRQYATSNRPADAEKIITAKVSNNPKEAAYAP